jgi:hypothetical protein
MPLFRFDRTRDTQRGSKVLVNLEEGITCGAMPAAEQHEGQPEDSKDVQATHG